MSIASTSVAFINDARALRAAFTLAALVLLPALAPQHARAQTTPAPNTKTTPTSSPSSSPSPAPDKPNAVAVVGAKAGSIKGRVVGEGGEPLAHAALYIINRSWGRLSRPRAPVTSDADGRFRFDELEPGLYGFTVYLPGYALETGATDNPTAGVYRVGDDVTIRLARGGVITGTVANADGEPVVGANVRVIRLRTLDGRATAPLELWFGDESPSDDRGVYRVYGLPPGVYLVAAGGGQRWRWSAPTPYDDDAPTYFRSAAGLDTAEEVTVRAGQEVGGIDLRYRGERGHVVGGVVVHPAGQRSQESVTVSLVHAATGTNAVVAGGLLHDNASGYGFTLEGVADGEYELRAVRYTQDGEAGASAPQRVSVRGADVTGLRVTLAPFGSVGGDLALEPLREPAGECKTAPRRAMLPQEVLIVAPRLDRTTQQRRAAESRQREATPDNAGAFQLRTLEAGRYRLEPRPTDEGWYVRDIQLPQTPPAATTAATANNTAAAKTNAAATRHALDLKPGQQLVGVKVFVAEGAAALSGRVAPREEGAALPPPARLRVHLVPAAREQAEDPLRFYETAAAPDYSFSLKSLAPGRYLLVVREAESETPARPAAWDADARARLRREAEAANVSVELQPCQRRTDFEARPPAPRD